MSGSFRDDSRPARTDDGWPIAEGCRCVRCQTRRTRLVGGLLRWQRHRQWLVQLPRGLCLHLPHNRSWDVVQKVKGSFATRNRAEYLTALEAIKRANIQDPRHEKTLVICSDTKLLVSKWVIDWMYDSWITSTGTPVKNRELLQLLLEPRGTRRAVVFEHVRAHTGGQDWASRWNDVADQAVRSAAWAAAQNAHPAVPRPRICMMPVLAAFGGEPNIRTYRDLYRGNGGGSMSGEKAAAAP